MHPIDDLCAFIDASPCPRHAVETLAERLRTAGFAEWSQHEAFPAKAGSRAFIRRGGALIAFVVRERATRFHLVGAHTDSPHLRLKPRAAYACEGCKQFGVEVYGSALWNSWLDRDLGVAGTVWTSEGQGLPIRIHRPLARVAQLAIHLDRKVNEDGLKLNAQQHLAPLWGLGGDAGAEFLKLLSDAARVDPRTIVSHDLSLYDLNPASRGGASGEFIFAGRLDNLASCHAGLQALIAASTSGRDDTVSVLACFDHEEVGSGSDTGAESTFLGAALERLALALGLDRGGFLTALSGSMLISADMAHAVHPNFPDRHEAHHKPRLGGGPVLKSNVNQRYATTGASAAQIQRYARSLDIPLQDFVTRSDLGCGSTIGPATAARLGIAVADVGNPMLSMHSIRECAATADHEPYIRLLTEHFLA